MWGEPTFRVSGRLFVMCASAENHHGRGREAVWPPAPTGAQAGLVAAAPDRFFVPPYVGKKGWIGVWLDGLGDDELELHLRQAYREVASAELQARME